MTLDLRCDAYLPFPELVERRGEGAKSRPYVILDSREHSGGEMSGSVNKLARLLFVPLDAYGRAVCRHEYGHIRWSLLSPPKVDYDPRVLAGVEDARVNLALTAAGLPVDIGEVGNPRVEFLVAFDAKHGDAFALFVRCVASVGTSVEPDLLALLGRLEGRGPAFAREAMQRTRAQLERLRLQAGGEVAPERKGRKLAGEFAFRMRALGLLDEQGMSRSRFMMDCCFDHALSPSASPTPDDKLGARRPEVLDLESGVMRIARARLTLKQRGRARLRTWRSSTEGSVIRHAHRWPIDRAIFRRRGARSRGTVLVDVSSSMSLNDDELGALLASAGEGVRVAIYSGTRDEGELRIVADAGRFAEGLDLERFGGGNVVDVPALRWLAHQPGPRLWVSDGAVTGKGDRRSSKIRAQCRAVCRRAAIRRVENVAEAAKLLGAQLD